MSKTIDINAVGLIQLSARLDKARKYDLPDVARNTLNRVGFDTKKKHLPEIAAKSFTTRNKQFFRRFSRVDKATGTKINSMRTTVGMDANMYKLPGDAVTNQLTQQTGKGSADRKYIPIDTARVSNSHDKNVRRINRMDSIDGIPVENTARIRANSQKKRYIIGAVNTVKKYGSGGLMLHKTEAGETVLYRVRKGRGKGVKTREGTLNVVPLYSVQDGRTTKPKKITPYTKWAGIRAGRKLNGIFVRLAKKRLRR